MIYRIEVSPQFIAGQLYTGKVIQKTQVTKGLPPGSIFFYAYLNERGCWNLMFEGKPIAGPDVEGAIEDLRVEFTSIYGNAPLPLPEKEEEG